MGEPEVSEKLKQLWFILNDSQQTLIIDKWWNRIENEYANNNKRKHNDLNHIAKMFIHLDEYQKEIKSAKAVSYAIFFNNLTYDPKSCENEENSIQLFNEFASEAGINEDDPIYKEVTQLIMLTKTHLTEEHKSKDHFGSEDKHYFLDFDLSYLGTHPDDYTIHALRIRNEYEDMPEQTYKILRAKVLKSILEIPKIYATKIFHEKYETQARNNIKCEIEILEA